MQQVALGVLGTLVVILGATIFFVVVFYNKKMIVISEELSGVAVALETVNKTLAAIPPTSVTQNVIHLGLKQATLDTSVETTKVAISLNPAMFQVSADRIREELLRQLETENHSDVDTRSWCILDHAGLSALVEAGSLLSVRRALTRLLMIGDYQATELFLETLANSIATGTKLPTE